MKLLPNQGDYFDITRLLRQQNIKHVHVTNDIQEPISVHCSVISRTRMTENGFDLSLTAPILNFNSEGIRIQYS